MWLLHWLMGANHAFDYRGDVVGFALMFLVSPVGVFLHEAGHALPALLLTRGNVDMHVGAKGPGMHLRAGRFRMTLHAWPDGDEHRAGWVRHQPTRVIWMLVITAGGPLFSCFGAVAGGTLAQRFALGSPPSLLFAALWFACSAHTVISLTGSDGATLRWLWRYARTWRPPPEDPNAATSVAPPSAEAAG